MAGPSKILLDTHIWIWWLNGSPNLPSRLRNLLDSSGTEGLCVSAISCWKMAKLVANGRLGLTIPVEAWIRTALQPPKKLLALTPEVAVESTRLPGDFHRDPADQIIVATARLLHCRLMTLDAQIQKYPHVELVT